MRLIDADKFLKETLTAGIGKTIIEYSESDIGYMIRRQPTVDAADVMRNQWISVKDRLPKGFEPVIVCREDGKVEQGYKDVGDWWKVYGVELSSAAERVLLGKYCDKLSAVNGSFGRRKKEKRKKTRRVSVRLTDEEFSRLQQHLKGAGVTAQDALTRWIENEIISKKGETQNDDG